MPEKEFKKWEGELVKRKPVQLRLLDVEMVGIKKNVRYETTGDYQNIECEKAMRAEQINHLVGEYGEVIYQ